MCLHIDTYYSSVLSSGNEISAFYKVSMLKSLKIKPKTGEYLDSEGVTKCFVGIPRLCLHKKVLIRSRPTPFCNKMDNKLLCLCFEICILSSGLW